jgi:hypothetical protein
MTKLLMDLIAVILGIVLGLVSLAVGTVIFFIGILFVESAEPTVSKWFGKSKADVDEEFPMQQGDYHYPEEAAVHQQKSNLG